MALHKGYGQFCPVARTAEILGERWTPLVVRELLAGSVRFNDLQRGVPRMSSALLAKRLKSLEEAGVIERRGGARGGGTEYHLTKAGRELFPIVENMGLWAQRWLRHDLVADENLDPDLLMWDIRRNAVAGRREDKRRLVVRFTFEGVPRSRRFYWLVFERGEVDLCIKDPGFDVDLEVQASIKALTEVWLGHRTLDEALKAGEVRLEGTQHDVGAFRAWFALSTFAEAAERRQVG
ncbi:MAG: helix-turn-helix transcriptional regulator [Kiloniellales bacterium]|nr:helix-turn-helix transcriptional regulator [Kiloniellales bacterium]